MQKRNTLCTPKPEVRGSRFGFYSGLELPFYFACGVCDVAGRQTKRLSSQPQEGQKGTPHETYLQSDTRLGR